MPSQSPLSIVPYRAELARDFYAINQEWISEMFTLEEKDSRVLTNPEREIIDGGGLILFVRAGELGIVGTGALLKTGESQYELTKMGVRKTARGLKAGEFLLQALIAEAKKRGAQNLYLLTNHRCEAAIHLYKKNGFEHDPEIMKLFGCDYTRCDVAMRYRG